MDPVSELVPCSSIRIFLMMENRLLREALIRLFRKRPDLIVVAHDGPHEPTASQVLDVQFDVLVMDCFQTGWPTAEIARKTEGRRAFKAILIGMEPNEELFITAVRSGVMGYLLRDASASDLVAAVRSAHRAERGSPPQLRSTLCAFGVHLVAAVPATPSASRPNLAPGQQQH